MNGIVIETKNGIYQVESAWQIHYEIFGKTASGDEFLLGNYGSTQRAEDVLQRIKEHWNSGAWVEMRVEHTQNYKQYAPKVFTMPKE